MKNSRTFICLLFGLSGCAALIYEILWFQLLKLTLGSSAISIGITVGTFMGGMCLGSLFFHRLVKDRWHPLKIYLVLELGIGLCGLLCLFFIPRLSGLYFAFAGYGVGGIALRCLVAVVFLVPPTMMMGATLPAIARWVETDRSGAASLGLFYSANLFGAVVGTLLAGFYILRLYDTVVASLFALSLNVIAAVAAYAIASRDKDYQAVDRAAPASTQPYLYWVIALSGFTALGAQIVWTRLIALYLGGTVYTFSIILAVFLIGLGLGSTLASRLQKGLSNRPATHMLLVTQILLVPTIWWAGFSLSEVMPRIHLFGMSPVMITRESIWIAKSCNDLVRVFITLFPATLMWGASFPFALAVASERDKAADRYSGRLYAANTLGAVIGATALTFICIPLIGTTPSQTVLMLGAVLSVVLLLLNNKKTYLQKNRQFGLKVFALAALVALSLIPVRPDDNMTLFGRLHTRWGDSTVLQIEEGLNSTVAISSTQDSGFIRRELHVSGKVVASTSKHDMSVQRQLGHLPALLHKEPKSVLVIGFGAGVTSGVFTLYDSIERIVIVEIEPMVPRLSGTHLSDVNYDVLNDPRTELIIDDGRHFLSTTDETFDIITTDPIHPWVKGAAALYTQEFYEFVVSKLNPGGLVTQWVPFYESDERSVRSQIATFVEVIPQASVWRSQQHAGYDVTLLGQLGPIEQPPLAIADRFSQPEIRTSMREVGIDSVDQFFQYYSGNSEDLAWWLAGADFNLDRNLRLEYLAGQVLDVQLGNTIYQNMVSRNENMGNSLRELWGLSAIPK